jgi:WD40 repeat protein
MSPGSVRDLVFVSYSHDDREWRDRLLLLLKPFVRQSQLQVWADPYIRSGDVWRREIDAALARSRVGVVLLTPALLASDFIADVELPSLLRAARAGDLTLLVVPVGHCVDGSTRFPDGDLTEFQWPWDAGDPLETLPQGKRNHALVMVTNAIVRATIDGSGRAFTVMPQATRSAAQLVSPVAEPGAVHGVPPFPPNYILRHESHDELKRAVLGSFAVVGVSAGDSRIGLHGQGGIGKTVVAMGVACDEEVRRAFPDGVYWLTLGQQPRLESLQSLLASYFGDRQPIDDIGAGIRLLRERLQGKACLLVLDDVWQLVHAKAFDVLDSRSRLLVTTRDSSVLTALGARHLRVDALPTEVALDLMARWAGLDPSALPAVARDVVEEVECLPLGLSLAGAQVRDGRRWEDLLSALREGDLIYLDHPYGSVLKSMQASVDALGTADAARYLDLAIFPEDAEIPAEIIEALWASTGGIDARGTRALLTRFASRNLLRLSRVDTQLEAPEVAGTEHATRRLQHVVSLHDLQRDFTRLLVEDLPTLHARLIETFRATLRPAASGTVADRWALLPEDTDYRWQFLAYHLVGAGREHELERLLTDADWLYARLTRFSSLALTADYQYSLADSGLRAIRDAIVLSAHVLARDPDALMSQLAGRLRSNRDPRIQALIDSTPAPLRGSARLHPLVGRLAAPGGPLLQTFEGHSDRVWAVTLLPDGQHALSGSVDGTLKLWDLASGAVLQTFVGHAGAVTAVTVLPDGRRAVSGSADRMLKLWDLSSGAVLQTFEGHRQWVRAVTLLSDQRRLVSGGEDCTVRLWDLASGSVLRTFEGHAGAVRSVIELPDAKRILSGSADRTLKVWDLESGSLLQTFEGHSNWINGVAALPNGRHAISASDDGTLQVWDVDSGLAVQTLSGHSGGVNAVTVLAEGQRVLSGGDDGTVKLWDLASGTVSRSFDGHADWVRVVTVLPDGQRALSASDDRTLKLWDLATDAMVPSFECHTDWVRGVAVLPDRGRALSASYDGTLKLWSLASGAVIKTLEGHTDGVTAVALLPGGERALSGSDDGTLKLWDLESGAVLSTFTGHTGAVLAVAVMPDGHRALSGSYDRTLKLWELESGQLLRTFVGHTRAINAVTPLPTGERALSGGADRALTVWNLADGSVLQTFHGHERRVWAVAVLPDGDRALSGGDQTLKLWDLASGALLRTFAGHTDRIWDVAVLPGGLLAVSASDDNTLKLWNLETGTVVATFYGDAPYHCVSAASHDAIVAGDALGRIHVLSVTGQPAASTRPARGGA